LVVTVCIISVLVGLTAVFFAYAQDAADKLQKQLVSISPKEARPHPPRRNPKHSHKVPNQYLVTFNNTVTDPAAEANRLAQTVPATVLSVYRNVPTKFGGCAVRIQPGDLPTLQTDPKVAAVEQDVHCYPMQNPGTIQTGVSRIQFKHAPRTPPFTFFFPASSAPPIGGPRNLPTTPPTKVVAVTDTEIDRKHPELNVQFVIGFGGLPKGAGDHGTHVAGIIGARGIRVQGVFPGVPLWSLRVFDANGGGGTAAVLLEALSFALDSADQISVLNMSLGFPQTTVLAVNNAVTACVDAGIVVCVAAGNDAKDAGPQSPANAPGVICVGAMADTDGLPGGRGPAASDGDPDDTFASFSNFGPIVTIVAPGVDILSTFPVKDGSYALDTGTSMACPHVAGMCALALSDFGGSTTPGRGPRNLPPGSGGGIGIVINNPFLVQGLLLQESVETIQGLTANGDDTRNYPMLTGRP
jgi:subtilisin family serine protease